MVSRAEFDSQTSAIEIVQLVSQVSRIMGLMANILKPALDERGISWSKLVGKEEFAEIKTAGGLLKNVTVERITSSRNGNFRGLEFLETKRINVTIPLNEDSKAEIELSTTGLIGAVPEKSSVTYKAGEKKVGMSALNAVKNIMPGLSRFSPEP